MKKFILIFGLIMFVSCVPHYINGLPEGWLELPKEKIKSYFFHSDSVTFISENSDIKTFANIFNYYYEPYDISSGKEEIIWDEGEPEPSMLEGVPYEELLVGNLLKNVSTDERLNIKCNIHNRVRLHISYIFSSKYISGSTAPYQSGGGYVVRFETDPKNNDKTIGGYPKYPNEVFEHFTDTINLMGGDGDVLMGQLVAGKGLIWFTDPLGVKWYLQE